MDKFQGVERKVIDHSLVILKYLMRRLGITELFVDPAILDEAKKQTFVIMVAFSDGLIVHVGDSNKQTPTEAATQLMARLYNDAVDPLHLSPNMDTDLPHHEVCTLAEVKLRLIEKLNNGEFSHAEISGGLNVIQEMLHERGWEWPGEDYPSQTPDYHH